MVFDVIAGVISNEPAGNSNMAQLTIAVECTYPSDEEINAIYKAVESEFLGCHSMKKRHRFRENRKGARDG